MGWLELIMALYMVSSCGDGQC